MTLKDLLKANNVSSFYNRKPTGDKQIDKMNRWFYVDGKKKTYIENFDEKVLKSGKLNKMFNGWGQTPLTAAIINGQYDLVDILLKNGARADVPNALYVDESKKGQFPLELANQRVRFNKDDVAMVRRLEKALATSMATKRNAPHQF